MEDMTFAKLFGVVVRQLRHDAGFSQEEFATYCHLHRTYIGSIERGEKNVTLTTANKIAKALGIKLSDLILQMERYNDSDDKFGS
jgi:transcriptional regulator with XRE-family HTH domain